MALLLVIASLIAVKSFTPRSGAETTEVFTLNDVNIRSTPSPGRYNIVGKVHGAGNILTGHWEQAPGGQRWLHITEGPYAGDYVWSGGVSEQNPATSTPAAGPVSEAPSKIVPVQSTPQTADASQGGPITQTPALAENAKKLALAYLAAWSDSQDPDGATIAPFYATFVEFYGRTISRADLMYQKAQFARRWPVRQYIARPETLVATCKPPSDCLVSGTLDWSATALGDGRKSIGVAAFSMGFHDNLIVSESGKVLSRQ